MDCKTCVKELPEHFFDRQNAGVDSHLAECTACAEEAVSLQNTFDLLDAWKAPEPSAYFDQKLMVLLREEQSKAPAGWMERLRERLLFNTGRQFRPALAGALALVLLVGGGSFAGLSNFNQPAAPEASATVNDLQILDKNDQAIQQMDQLLQDDGGDGAQPTS